MNCGCALLAIWTLNRRSRAEQGALASQLARLEERCEAQRTSIERSDAARASAEADLRATEQRYLLALRGSQDGVWEWDLGSNAVQLSPRWKSMLGFESHQISDDRAGWLGRIHPDDRPRFEDALDRAKARARSGRPRPRSARRPRGRPAGTVRARRR